MHISVFTAVSLRCCDECQSEHSGTKSQLLGNIDCLVTDSGKSRILLIVCLTECIRAHLSYVPYNL